MIRKIEKSAPNTKHGGILELDTKTTNVPDRALAVERNDVGSELLTD